MLLNNGPIMDVKDVKLGVYGFCNSVRRGFLPVPARSMCRRPAVLGVEAMFVAVRKEKPDRQVKMCGFS